MGLLATRALENKAHVTGIVPRKLQDSERILKNMTETVLVGSLGGVRKRCLNWRMPVSLPGGFGTLDETLEVLYWGKLKLHTLPLVLVNIEGYWTGSSIISRRCATLIKDF